MPETSLLPRGALDGIAQPGRHGNRSGPAGVTVTVLPDTALASLIARAGAGPELARAVAGRFGIDLPETPRLVSGGGVDILWAGPARWLVRSAEGDGAGLEARLREAAGPLASVTDLSDSRTLLRVEGPRAGHLMAKGVFIDLDPAAFPPGSVALTTVAQVGVHLWRVDDHAFELATFRTYAASFWHWLTESAAEYGLDVVVPAASR